MPLRAVIRAAALGLLVFAASCAAPDRAPPPPESSVSRGAALAGQWCAQCHGQGGAPAFAEIVGRPGRDYMYLTNFMTDLHLPMPTYRLWPEERAAVVDYVLSLKKP